jgi:hypothetical protein
MYFNLLKIFVGMSVSKDCSKRKVTSFKNKISMVLTPAKTLGSKFQPIISLRGSEKNFFFVKKCGKKSFAWINLQWKWKQPSHSKTGIWTLSACLIAFFQAGKSSPGMLKEIGNRLFHLNTLIVRIYNMYLIPCVTHKQGYLFFRRIQYALK